MIFSFIAILFIPQIFAEGSFDGNSSIDPPLSEIFSGQSTTMNIRFQYTSGPYAMNNVYPIIEVLPSSAGEFVKVEVEPMEITQGQIKRIPVTLTVDSAIQNEKIFLSISYIGKHFQADELYKSSWNDQIALDVITQNSKLYPEPEQDISVPKKCGPGTTYHEGICVVNEIVENPVKSESNRWGATSSNYNIKSPLKQFREGISSYEIECRNGLVLILKIDGSPACIKSESHKKLYERGWTKLVPIQPEIGKTGTLDFQVNNENFKIKYDIRGGALDKIFYDELANSVIFQLNQPYNGELTVELPRTLMEIIQKDYDGDYFVLLDGVQTDFGFEDTSFGKKISIKIPQRTYEMELIGSF